MSRAARSSGPWLVLAGILAGCGASEPRAAPLPYLALPRDTLSVEAAREAHRRHEEHRELRFLEAIVPGHLLRSTRDAVAQERIDAGQVDLATLHDVGRLLFEHEHGLADGLGDGESRRAVAAGKSPFRRVHRGRHGGPETTACTSCHWRGGPGGAGGLQDASFILGDGDTVESADPRNPPPLHGAGVVEALAREMTEDLESIRARIVAEACRQGRTVEAKLTTKGVDLGVLRAHADGSVDASGVAGVDADLVVRPFGWKGTFATIRDFVSESLQLHFGIQSEDLVHEHRRQPDPELAGAGADPQDPDGDGVVSELTSGQLTALVAFVAMLELPVVRPPVPLHDLEPVAKHIPPPIATSFTDEWRRGRELFGEIGCASCHVPALVLKQPFFHTRSPVTGGVLEIDLSRSGERPGLRYDPELGGYPVWLFSDLKRHDLGAENASRHVDHGVPRQQYLTRRLWGLASSPPYFYDGSAPWLDHAIEAHFGEAAEARKTFLALGREDQGALRVFLLSLTRERRLVVP